MQAVREGVEQLTNILALVVCLVLVAVLIVDLLMGDE